MTDTKLLSLLREKEAKLLDTIEAIRLVIRITEQDLPKGEARSNMYQIRDEFRKKRKISGINQWDAAMNAGVSIHTLVRYEQGLAVKRETENRILNFAEKTFK